MNLQDGLALMTFFLAIATLVFAVGKQTQKLAAACDKLNDLSCKFDIDMQSLIMTTRAIGDRYERRVDNLSTQAVRLEQRLISVERHIYHKPDNDLYVSGLDFTDEIE